MSVIKLQAPFERLIASCGCPEISLQRAIILQAIIDASNSSKNKYAVKIENSAKKWLNRDNISFQNTCQEAGLAPEFVLKAAEKVINRSIL